MLASEQLATTQSQRAQTQTQPAPTTPTTPALAPRGGSGRRGGGAGAVAVVALPRTRRVVFGPPTRAARRERDADAVARPFIPRAAPSDLPSSPLAQLCFLTLPAPNASLRRRSSSSRSRSFASTTSSRRRNLRHRHQGTRRDARGLFPLAARPPTAGADPTPSFCSPAQKVKEAGHCTVKSLLTVPKKCLIEVKGLSDAKVDKMLESAMKLLRPDQAGGFVTASEWIERCARTADARRTAVS